MLNLVSILNGLQRGGNVTYGADLRLWILRIKKLRKCVAYVCRSAAEVGALLPLLEHVDWLHTIAVIPEAVSEKDV